MNTKGLLSIASTVLVLAMVLTGCTSSSPSQTTAQPTVTVTATPKTATPQVVVQDKAYKALDPRGEEMPVQISSLAKRLDTLDGKTIYIDQGEADPVIMPALYKIVQEKYPKTTWKYIATSGFGPATLEEEVTQNAKAVIRGISW